MARTDGRVDIGKNPKEELDIALQIAKKHKELGAQSPLNVMDDIDWTALEPKITAALDAHEQAEKFKKSMEMAYRERDASMPEIDNALKASVKLLKASFHANPKKLGDWGLNVDDSPQVKKKTTDKP